MLLCPSREDRVAYVLAEVFDLPGDERLRMRWGSRRRTYRKRVSRARNRLRSFMEVHCGLISEAAACRCVRRIDAAIATGRLESKNLLFAGRGAESTRQLPVAAEVKEMEELHRIAGIYRSHARYAAPEAVLAAIRDLLAAGQFSLLN